MGFGVGTADVVDAGQILFQSRGDAIEVHHLVDRPGQAPLGTGTVVTHDVEHQGVVGVGTFTNRREQPTDLVVGERQVTGEVLHEPRIQPLLVGAQRVPGRAPLRSRCVLRVRRDDAHLALPLKRLLTHRIPALVELTGETLAPLRPDVVWSVHRTGREVHQHWLVGVDRLAVPQPTDRPVGHIRHEVIALFGCPVRFDRHGVLEQHRVVLVGLPTDEPVEVIEAQPGRPPIERTHHTGLPIRSVVVLAEPRRVVAVLLENLAHRCRRARNHRGVARVSGRPFGEEP